MTTHLAPTNIRVFTEEFTEHILSLVQKLVTRELRRELRRKSRRKPKRTRWSLEQIQLAEDYIQTLSKGYPPFVDSIPKPIGLTGENARKIRALIKEQKRIRKWNDNKWQQFESPDQILLDSCNMLGVSQEHLEAAQDYLLDLQKDPAAPVPELLSNQAYTSLVEKVKELARFIELSQQTALRTS